MRALGIDITPRLAVLVCAAALLGFSLGPSSRVRYISTGSIVAEADAERAHTAPSQGVGANRSAARNVVLTMAGGPNYEGEDGRKWAARFGGSFRRVNEAADVVFFTPGVADAVVPLAETLRLTPHVFNADPASDEPWSRMEVAARRWHLFREFLDAHQADYAGGAVLAIDARDSFFQRDPFALMAEERARRASGGAGAEVLAFLEHEVTVGSSPWNSDVIAACYPSDVLKFNGPVSRGAVSCSGTLLGSYEGVLEYLRAMEEEMSTPRATTATCQAAGGRDQGFHNVLLHSGRLAARLARAGLGGLRMFANADGPVQTLQFGDLDVDALGRVLNSRGAVAHIVHQIDRKRVVSALVDSLFPLVEPVHQTAWDAKMAQWQDAARRRPAAPPLPQRRATASPSPAAKLQQ